MKLWLLNRRVKAPWLDPADRGVYTDKYPGTIIRVNPGGSTVAIRFDDGFVWQRQPLHTIDFSMPLYCPRSSTLRSAKRSVGGGGEAQGDSRGSRGKE